MIASPATFYMFTFKVCATGNVAGVATVIAIIESVRPEVVTAGQKYELKEPEPAESARVTFDVVR
jgi:hypothetical protein